MSDTTTTSTSSVVNEVISLVQGSASSSINAALQTKITGWINEIASTQSPWVKARDTIYIISSSWAGMMAMGKINTALGKLQK